jgi:putative Holliday junction resolvase
MQADTAVPGGYILSFDFGQRRIGVAVGQATTRTASRLETVRHDQAPDWDAIDRLVGEWKPEMLLVGLPLGSEGEETDMSRMVRKFGGKLRNRYSLDVAYFDERLSSHAAETRFVQMRAWGGLRRHHANQMDAIAAQIILENWLESLPRDEQVPESGNG